MVTVGWEECASSQAFSGCSEPSLFFAGWKKMIAVEAAVEEA